MSKRKLPKGMTKAPAQKKQVALMKTQGAHARSRGKGKQARRDSKG